MDKDHNSPLLEDVIAEESSPLAEDDRLQVASPRRTKATLLFRGVA
jgi:hypothetical protein